LTHAHFKILFSAADCAVCVSLRELIPEVQKKGIGGSNGPLSLLIGLKDVFEKVVCLVLMLRAV